MKKISVVLIAGVVLALAGAALAQDDDYDSVSALSFVVLKDYNGKPIRNASVVLHPVNKKGKQEKGGLELKADADGKCYFDGIPYGKLRVQVLATGFQTFGQDYDINQPKVTITVKMQRPQGQYSIYTDSQNDEKKGAAPPADGSKPKAVMAVKGCVMDYLLKTEPSVYSFADLQREKTTIWDGVSNPAAVKNLRGMKSGDRLVIYHTGDEKSAVGTATVVSVEADDPKNPRVKIKAGKSLSPVTLGEVKAQKLFADSPLVRQGRLSVVPLTAEQYKSLSKE